MGWLKGAIKAGIVMKVAQVVAREASKPENQRKAKEVFDRLASRAGSRRPH
jgi:hypothetical protein